MVGIKICLEEGCKNQSAVNGYCRLHYLKNWKRLKQAEKKRVEDKLDKYVEGICRTQHEYGARGRREVHDMGDISAIVRPDPAREELEDLFKDLGYRDESNIDKLISQIKLDKDF